MYMICCINLSCFTKLWYRKMEKNFEIRIFDSVIIVFVRNLCNRKMEMFTYRELAAKACFRELHPTNAALIMAQSGSKGKILLRSKIHR